MTEIKDHKAVSRILSLIVLAVVLSAAFGFFILQLYHLLHPVFIE